MHGDFKDIYLPIELNITVDSSKLTLPEELKVGVMNALANDIDFCIMDDDNKNGAVFLRKRYMVTIEDGTMSFTIIKDQKALMNSISVIVPFYRNFVPLSKILGYDQIDKLITLACSKTLILTG